MYNNEKGEKNRWQPSASLRARALARSRTWRPRASRPRASRRAGRSASGLVCLEGAVYHITHSYVYV